jgi:hypothetical protein
MQPPILREVGVDLPIPTRIVVLLDKRRQFRQLFRRKLFHSFFDFGQTHPRILRTGLTARNALREG